MKTIDLPKISLQNFNTNNTQAFETLRKLLREISTFYGIDLYKRVFEFSRRFFALTQEQKEKISLAIPNNPTNESRALEILANNGAVIPTF
ncbi:hypothetical protein [Campylobacter sp. MIT 97-5078]|uniref:hypothetical protein n=1 Tax=Campylobacter sp. MIT 97-5078 TaxID=1548153 RepID=UPI000512F8FF|nr:hypothetical protein [Campylobacter sp. MIT 97-5078]KGI55542.1 hypothetical protein LR59_11540 [Campylobacter sp. MIT 97-5078]TQR27301.1 hypothetical protein DMB91_04705 [Campylobacter sp. MIT 97-5078]